MKEVLGSLANAPLAFVIAQIRLIPSPSFNQDQVATAMHDKLFDAFPRRQHLASQRLVVGADGIPHMEEGDIVASLASHDQHEEILISSVFLAFQVTKYENYNIFRANLEAVIAAMFEHYGKLAIQQLGLRYIDFIYPRVGDNLENYLPAAATRLKIEDKLSESSLHVSESVVKDGRVILKFTTGQGKASLPAELGPVFNLRPSPIMQVEPDSSDTAILDIDRIYTKETNKLKDLKSVMEVFDLLHKDTSILFKKLTTDHAMKIWKNEI
jgi:uncharacterized protein (TIGR04255 family)